MCVTVKKRKVFLWNTWKVTSLFRQLTGRLEEVPLKRKKFPDTLKAQRRVAPLMGCRTATWPRQIDTAVVRTWLMNTRAAKNRLPVSLTGNGSGRSVRFSTLFPCCRPCRDEKGTAVSKPGCFQAREKGNHVDVLSFSFPGRRCVTDDRKRRRGTSAAFTLPLPGRRPAMRWDTHWPSPAGSGRESTWFDCMNRRLQLCPLRHQRFCTRTR